MKKESSHVVVEPKSETRRIAVLWGETVLTRGRRHVAQDTHVVQDAFDGRGRRRSRGWHGAAADDRRS